MNTAYPPFKTVYLYDDTTGILLGRSQAQLSPEGPEGEYIKPVHCTELAPPSTMVNQAPVFANGKWSVVPDFRGSVWYDSQGGPVEITTLGTPVGLTATPPAPPPPTLDEQRQELQNQMDSLELKQLMPRLIRERTLKELVSEAQPMTEAQLYTTSVQYKKLKDVDNQVSSLRTQLLTIK
jgi:hypothetical protein